MKGWVTYSPGRWFWVHEREAALVVFLFHSFSIIDFYYSILSFVFAACHHPSLGVGNCVNWDP